MTIRLKDRDLFGLLFTYKNITRYISVYNILVNSADNFETTTKERERRKRREELKILLRRQLVIFNIIIREINI